MGILAWTLGPSSVATALAILWVHWTGRPRGPVETRDSLAAHARFKAALEAPSRTPVAARKH
jgi:hypothetical protein